MALKTDLSGEWLFAFYQKDEKADKQSVVFDDTIILPATFSSAGKGTASEKREAWFLTDPREFSGQMWYQKKVNVPAAADEKYIVLELERTRVSHLWIDDMYIGTQNSLSAPHRYVFPDDVAVGGHILTIMTDNASYPIGGGHLTSPDTQTNWNGITGAISLCISDRTRLSDIRIYPDAEERRITVKARLHNAEHCTATVTAAGGDFARKTVELYGGECEFVYELGEKCVLWSEFTPVLYSLWIKLGESGEEYVIPFGVREFRADGKYFSVNGTRTFLRGKHDGMIFPLTAHAPTELSKWLSVMKTARDYGINHYRFHTCCPPAAAFTAADILGIYIQPELMFWGTIYAKNDAEYDENAQQYLLDEGKRMLAEYGNHPSFVMFSLGNELWGNKERLNEMMGELKAFDSRPLYTQGSNNYQFTPCILENDDFFSGVRFSKERLFRGSYAMCDAPQGHIQTKAPDFSHNYDEIIRSKQKKDAKAADGFIQIQAGTGVKTVKAQSAEELVPDIPVISHEIGQYCMYPDFNEIEKYTGVLKPRSFEIFRERLIAAGMADRAEKFCRASGRFAAECYKAEIETAMRSDELAGFQLLDIQDFTGQGTAIVGILDAFMDNKGHISREEWNGFCGESVLLAELPRMVFKCGEKADITIKTAYYGAKTNVRLPVCIALTANEKVIYESTFLTDEIHSGVNEIGKAALKFPAAEKPYRARLTLSSTVMENHYDLWIYPPVDDDFNEITVCDDGEAALKAAQSGKNVLYFPQNLDGTNSAEGTYCTDFWCYPMFRSISESMGKAVPVGTLGLCIDEKHAIFSEFPTEFCSTPQWYDIVSHSRAEILDGSDICPIVQVIDNVERNHKLGMIYETESGAGKIITCTCDLRKLDSLPAKWLMKSICAYLSD